MCSIVILMIFISSFHQVLLATSSKKDGHCVMYDQCKGYDGAAPCVYKGPPKQLEKDFQIDGNITAVQLLQELCPEFAFDDDPYVCCSAKQLSNFKEQMDLAEVAGFSRCPSCYHNFRQLICFLSCSPWQNEYLNVTKSYWYKKKDGSENEVVEEAEYHLSELYAYSLFDSCKELQGFIPGTLFLDFACGSWGGKQCSPERWLEFIGSTPYDGGQSPFKCHYVLHVEDKININGQTFYPMKEPHFKCSEAPRPDLSACNCYDCKEACSVQALAPPVIPTIPEPFHIFKRDGPTVVAALVFVLFVITITMIFCCHKNPGFTLHQLYPVPDPTTSPTSINLGSLEEIEPLRSKANPVSVSRTKPQRRSQKLQTKPSKFQRLGSGFEKCLESQFQSWGLYVSERPITIMIVSLFVCSVFSFGLFLNFDVTTNPVDLWVSSGSEARRDMEDYNKHFGPFYRIEHIIITPKNQESFYYPVVLNHELKNISWGPVFQQDFLLAALDLQLQIENLTAAFDNDTIHLKDICLSPLKPLNSACAIQSIFGFYQNKADFFQNETDYLTHFKRCSSAPKDSKCFAPFGGPIDSAAVVLGGFNETYDSAQALVIAIPVINYNDYDMTLKARVWESKFLSFIKNYSHPLMNIAYKAERSIQDEIERGSHSDLLTVAISYMLMFGYITVSLGEYHECKTLLVESKFTLGFFGVLIVLISVISSLGLFTFLGIPATLIIVEVIPFLVLAVGVDNIFILVQAFQRGEKKPGQSLEERIGYVVGKVAPSMLLSSISMSSCFFIGTLTEMPAVRLFALYAGVALLVNFFLQMTCFLGLFILDSKRQEAHRLDVCCCIRTSKNVSNVKSSLNEGLMFKSIKNLYSPFLMKNSVRYVVMIIFMGWLCSSAAVLDKIEIGFDQKLSVPEDSYMLQYFDSLEKYLSVGPPVYFGVSSGYNYSDPKAQKKICSAHGFCDSDSISTVLGRMAMVKNRTFIALQPLSWLDSYFEYLQAESCCYEYRSNGTHCPSYIASQNRGLCRSCQEKDPTSLSEVEFIRRLQFFLSDSPWEKCPRGGKAMFGSAIEFISSENTTKIGATNFMTYHTVLKTSKDFYEALDWARKIAANLTESLRNATGDSEIRVFPYSLVHVFYEQYLTMWPDTLRSLGLSTSAVFVATFLLLGLDLHSAVIVTISVMAIVINIMGLMYWWDISLNAVSLVNLVVAVGISVEFCSHLTRSFVLSEKPSRVLRAQEALSQMGTSLLFRRK
ncbi:unnamed protein product [Larinioides sclopetarius]|uniref:SSD domain-containing protein n=1 Tax=Larinioides sclopetarius TaxID=280406 RepID=A0AAV2AEG7_9ARAC